ncbi:MAG TPA: enoyl-CoA hydratase-related protein [Solirubrobacter sp.]|nr:enoyl-CoA hydratase-related protein [Solirubrobacter sp.]
MTTRIEHRHGFAIVTLASEHNRNALSLRMLEELLEHVAAAADGRGLVLDHEGPVFCAGVDIRERRRVGGHSELLARLLRALRDYPRPFLCRVDGPVRGGGMGLIAPADIVVASERASFAYSEVKVGVAPALVLAVTKVPPAPLAPWLLTGEPFDAPTALRLGLVTRVGESLEPELSAIRAAGPEAVATVKALVREGIDLDEAARLSEELFSSAEAREGMAAFAERRSPSWA